MPRREDDPPPIDVDALSTKCVGGTLVADDVDEKDTKTPVDQKTKQKKKKKKKKKKKQNKKTKQKRTQVVN